MSNDKTELRLELSGRRWRTHYSITLMPLILSAVLCYNLITWPFSDSTNTMVMVTLVFVGLFLISAWWQSRRLLFTCYHTPRSSSDNFDLVAAKGRELGWEITNQQKGEMIEFAVSGFPVSVRSWGEMVTVRFGANDVYVNSICNPDKRASVTAYGKNRENVKIVEATISEVNK